MVLEQAEVLARNVGPHEGGAQQADELVTETRPGAPRKPLTGPAAPGSRRIGAAAWTRRVLGPLARPIPRLEPTRAPANPL